MRDAPVDPLPPSRWCRRRRRRGGCQRLLLRPTTCQPLPCRMPLRTRIAWSRRRPQYPDAGLNKRTMGSKLTGLPLGPVTLLLGFNTSNRGRGIQIQRFTIPQGWTVNEIPSTPSVPAAPGNALGIAGARRQRRPSTLPVTPAASFSPERAPPLASLRSVAAANIFRPSSVPAASAMRGDTASPAAANVSGVDPHPLSLAINGAARRRSEAAYARRRKTSEHGAPHVARAAPAVRAESQDEAAVRVHRRRTDQGDAAPRSSVREGGKTGTYAARLSLSHDSTPWAPSNGAPWRRRWPAANDYVSGF